MEGGEKTGRFVHLRKGEMRIGRKRRKRRRKRDRKYGGGSRWRRKKEESKGGLGPGENKRVRNLEVYFKN